jgi:nitroreductase
MNVMETIKTRRSIRKYTSDPILKEDLEIILEAIRWAPSWVNSQCWEVIIVAEKERREKLAEAFSPKNPGVKALLTAPTVIVMAGKKGVSGYYKGKAVTIYGDWFMFDVALAMQNLALAAHSRGLGTVDLGYFDHEKVARLLEVPEDIQVVAMTPLGYPADAPKPPSRKSLTDFVSYEKFGRRIGNP